MLLRFAAGFIALSTALVLGFELGDDRVAAEPVDLAVVACENLAPFVDGDAADATTAADLQAACVEALPPTGPVSIASVEFALGDGDGVLTWEEVADVSFLDHNRMDESCTYEAVIVQQLKPAAGCTLLMLAFMDDERPTLLNLPESLTTIEGGGVPGDFACETEGVSLGEDSDCLDIPSRTNGDGVIVFHILNVNATNGETEDIWVMQEAVVFTDQIEISGDTRNDTDAPLDPDGDGIQTVDGDNCPLAANPDQTNTDSAVIATAGITPVDVTAPNGDGLGDACDGDDDNDGASDSREEFRGPCDHGNATSSLRVDSDGDTWADLAECPLFANPADPASRPRFPDPADDPDGDGVPSWLEGNLGADPNDADTDDDGISDGVEFKGYATSPSADDTDGDGCSDGLEISSVDRNYIVNSQDLLIVALSIGIDTRTNIDIDKSGIINVADLGIVASNFGLACNLPD